MLAGVERYYLSLDVKIVAGHSANKIPYTKNHVLTKGVLILFMHSKKKYTFLFAQFNKLD